MEGFDLMKIFGSKCRTKILEKFFLDYASSNDELYHMRWIARDIDEQINSVKRELDNLEALWILHSKTENKKRYFSLNTNFFLAEEFKWIFLKNYNPLDNLKNYLESIENLDLIIVSETLQNRLFEKTSNIVDIFLIGEIDKTVFNDYLAKAFFNKKIKYAIITKQDFYTRLEYNDKLIFDILNQETNVVLKDNIWASNYIKEC